MTRQGFANKIPGQKTPAQVVVEVAPVVETEKPDLKKRLLNGTHSFAGFSISWLIITLLLSLFEVHYIGFMQEYPEDLSIMLPVAFRNSALFWLKYNIILYLPFILLYQASSLSAKLIFSGILVLICLNQYLLVEYFSASLIPLGADLYGYSKTDIQQTVGASGSINIITIFNFVVILAVAISILVSLSKRIKLHTYVASALPVASLLILTLGTSSFRPSPFPSDFANNLTLNKSDFFYSETLNHFFPSLNAESDEELVSVKSKQLTFNYVDEKQYPFLHVDNTPDVLSPFLNKSETPPNIVIILVEGLGRAFTNEGAYLGNFTPFLDSLSGKSLYWKNFLSQGGRTFAVLPSLLGSLPFGEKGFLSDSKLPKHLSLLSLLKTNGYQTSFYYGGDSKFDNMELFLKENATDAIYEEKTFPAGYTKMPASNQGFSWGYGDSELFRRYMEADVPQSKPKLNVVLTVSTHSPFILNNQAEYLQVFEKRMQKLNFDEKKKKAYRNYDTKYASILYADNSLKKFFADYSKRTDYANTIFFITGDHRMPELPMSTKIDRYHVPLIVYSPLLKRTAKFASVSSHFDIAPSIMAFLSKNYTVKKPAVNSWIGEGLDTARKFRNIHNYALIQTKTTVIDYVSGNYHLNGEKLFTFTDNLGEIPTIEKIPLKQLKSQFNLFKKKNTQFAKGAKLLPDSVYQKYFPR
ncbi:MAG: LTA synthase family protein [Pyrinomonadaceae bacterium]|nr:LTA synthase family protein [Sphingobacteriaceae bacterium]